MLMAAAADAMLPMVAYAAAPADALYAAAADAAAPLLLFIRDMPLRCRQRTLLMPFRCR